MGTPTAPPGEFNRSSFGADSCIEILGYDTHPEHGVQEGEVTILGQAVVGIARKIRRDRFLGHSSGGYSRRATGQGAAGQGAAERGGEGAAVSQRHTSGGDRHLLSFTEERRAALSRVAGRISRNDGTCVKKSADRAARRVLSYLCSV